MFHDDLIIAHQNEGEVMRRIKEKYLWPNLAKDVKEYVKTCYTYQQRGSQKENNIKRTIKVNNIFERWGIDVVGPLIPTEQGNRYIIVAMEYFTRWPEARTTKTANLIDTATFIYEEIICRFEAPKVIQSDQGTHFVNKVIKELTKRFQVKYSLSSPYHPQSNGLVERFNRTLCEGLAKLGDSIHDWDKFIQPVLFAYRIK